MVCGRAGWTPLEVCPLPAGSEGPGLRCASPTPTTAQAKTMGACALPPGYRGQGPHQLAPRQPCQPPPPPGTTRARQPGPSRAVPAPGNFNGPQPGAQALLGRPGGCRWALTTVLRRWLCTVKSGQKSRSAMARSRDSASGRAFSSSSSACLGHDPQRPFSRGWPRRGGPRTWGAGGGQGRPRQAPMAEGERKRGEKEQAVHP